jgi:hypothetical protein
MVAARPAMARRRRRPQQRDRTTAGLRHCRYHGADGPARWVGLGVIANNLMRTATFMNARATA